jgi:hypothetical protein
MSAANWITSDIQAVLRSKFGLAPTDASKDAEIEALWISVVDMLGDYLDRKLPLDDYEERVVQEPRRVVSLLAYPIEGDPVAEDENGKKVEPANTDRAAGLLMFHDRIGQPVVNVFYRGGYDAPPAAILAVVMAAFGELAGAMSGGAAAASSAEVRSISVPDVGTVSYQSSAASASAGSAAGSGGPKVFGPFASLLRPYFRRQT